MSIVTEKYSQFLKDDSILSIYQYLTYKGIKIYHPYQMFVFMYFYFLRMPKQISIFNYSVENRSWDLIDKKIDEDKFYISRGYRNSGDKICQRWQMKYLGDYSIKPILTPNPYTILKHHTGTSDIFYLTEGAASINKQLLKESIDYLIKKANAKVVNSDTPRRFDCKH